MVAAEKALPFEIKVYSVGRGRRTLSFSAETASLILPHSGGIVLQATAWGIEGASIGQRS